MPIVVKLCAQNVCDWRVVVSELSSCSCYYLCCYQSKWGDTSCTKSGYLLWARSLLSSTHYVRTLTDTFCPHIYNFKIFPLNEIQLSNQMCVYSVSARVTQIRHIQMMCLELLWTCSLIHRFRIVFILSLVLIKIGYTFSWSCNVWLKTQVSVSWWRKDGTAVP